MNQPTPNFNKEKLPGRQVFGYLMGAVPATLFIGFFGFAYTKFFFDDLQLEWKFWIAGLIIYAVINAFNDPIIGYLSDNTDVNRWGSRRIIYIKWGAPIWGLAFLLIWWIPTDHGSQFLLFLHFTITLCFYDTMMTMVIMCWLALLPDMTSDDGERTKINFLGSIIVLLCGFPLLVVSTLDHEQIKIWAVVIAVVGVICYIIVVIFSKEKPEHQHDPSLPFWKATKYTLKNRAHLTVIAINFMNGISGSMTGGFLFLYWIILGEENLPYYFLLIFVVGYGSNLIAMSLRKKYGMFKLMIRYGIIQVIGGLATFIIVLNPEWESLIWVGIGWNVFFGGAGVFRGVMHLLVMDEDELKSGQRREGMYFGMNALITKPADSLGPIIGSAVLLTYGFIQGADAAEQPSELVVGIKILFLLVPQIINVISLILIKSFPLQGEKLTEMQERLAILHAEKREIFANDREI